MTTDDRLKAQIFHDKLMAEMYRLRAENEQLRDDLDLRNQTAVDRKEIIQRLEAENERLRAALKAVAFGDGRLIIAVERLADVRKIAKAALEQEPAK